MELARKVVAKRSTSRAYYELVRTFGDDLFPLLEEIFAAPRDEFDLWHCARSMALYDDARAAEKLATVLRKGKIKPYASDFFVRFPHHAEAVLAPMGKGKTKLAELAREILESARRKSSAAPLSEEAPAGELPAILVTPPWTIKKRPAMPTLQLDRPMPPRKELISVNSDVVSVSVNDAAVVQAQAAEMTPEVRAELEKALASQSHTDILVYKNMRVPDDVQLAAWDAGAKVYSYSTDIIDYMLGKFGERALEGLLKYAHGAFSYASEAHGLGLLGVDSPRLARALVKYTSKGDSKPVAWRWIRMHPETTAFALVRDALAGAEQAEFLMRFLVREGVDVLGAIAPWGDDVTAVMKEWLAFDRRWVLPKKVPRMPPCWKPDTYTRPLTRDGKPLPLSAIDAIGMMLAISTHDDPYAGIADVKAACEPRSLAEFSWDVARSWEHAGAKSQLSWMRDALTWFADDEVVRRTTPAMRVENALPALTRIGTPAAQMELVTIAAKGHAGAERALTDIADAAHVSKEELEDRIVPTAGLDAKGEIALDFGPRTLKVGFDSRLEPYVIGADGSKIHNLPPTRKTDDPEKAEIAKRIWQELKEDVGALAIRRIAVLERAMCKGRTWSPEDFDALFVKHPLTSHLARGIVWCALPDTLFRIAEDGSLADENDAPVDLAGGIVQIAHPIRNGTDALARWQQPFADYELVQPFQQIGRIVRALPEVDAKQTELEVDIPPIESSDFRDKLKTYDREGTRLVRPMYEGKGNVTITPGASRISSVKLLFTRKRMNFFLSAVPEIDISEALHDILD
jgi:hypothetical protein